MVTPFNFIEHTKHRYCTSGKRIQYQMRKVWQERYRYFSTKCFHAVSPETIDEARKYREIAVEAGQMLHFFEQHRKRQAHP